MQNRSRDGLVEFLDWTGTKGLMPLATVQSRKAAVGKVLSILTDEEAQDVSDIDVGDVMRRFENLMGKNYSPGSLKTYQSRLKSTLDDFNSYLESPMNFKPSSGRRSPRSNGSTVETSSASTSTRAKAVSEPPQRTPAPPSAGVLPIPVRADLTVYVQGIPFDLSKVEARKIANVIMALASEDNE